MANKDLFEQAIADAKKLKEISMANAKQAIEEAFAPRIQEMFRMKLSEIDDTSAEVEDDIEDITEDDYTEDGMEGGVQEGSHDVVDEMTLEEILAELELEGSSYEDEHPFSDEPGSEEGAPFGLGKKNIPGTEKGYMSEAKEKDEAEEAEEDEAEETKEDEAGEEVAELTVAEFEKMMRDVLADILSGQGAQTMEPETGDMEEPADEAGVEGDVIPLDEILAELEMEEGLGKMLKTAGTKLGALVAGADPKLYAQCKEEGKSINRMTTYDGQEMTEMEACLKEKGGKMGATAYKGAAGFTGELEEDKMEEGLGSLIKKVGNKFGAMVAGADSKLYAQCKEEGKSINKMTTYDGVEMTEMEACLKEKGGKMGATKYKGAAGFTGELEEAIETINVLKAELNEVNLLNAKLLYVNRLFKAKSLSESQKVKVITAFDRATTIRETKNIYETLKESLNTTAAVKKAPLKESLGFASKPIGSAPARPIVEADAYVYRMQQLAGIRQPNI